MEVVTSRLDTLMRLLAEEMNGVRAAQDRAARSEEHPSIKVTSGHYMCDSDDDVRYVSSLAYLEDILHKDIASETESILYALKAVRLERFPSLLQEFRIAYDWYYAAHEDHSLDWAFTTTLSEDQTSARDWFEASAKQFAAMCRKVLAVLDAEAGLTIDESRFVVTHLGQECDLGNSREFRFLRRLNESLGRYVTHESLIEAVSGSVRARTTVKDVKSRVAARLREAGLHVLADSIVTQTGHYALMLGRATEIRPTKRPSDHLNATGTQPWCGTMQA